MSELEWLDRIEQLSATWKDRCDRVSPTTNRYECQMSILNDI